MFRRIIVLALALAACKEKSDPPSAPAAAAVIQRKIPSGSMIPTFAAGERFVAGQMTAPPRRGDILVFKFPEQPAQEFVKRVIALEGDKLEMKDGHPVLNGWAVPSCVVGAYAYVDDDEPKTRHDGELQVEFLDDVVYLTYYDRTAPAGGPNGPWAANKGETWVLGDNRNNSHDSRMWFNAQGGGVPKENLLGRVEARAPKLPPDAPKELQPKLEECLKTRPASKPPKP